MKFRVNAIAIITAAFFALATQVVAAQESIILSFNGYDGYYPYGGLVADGKGNFFGAASSGGTFSAGTVYELSPSSGGWTETTLYSFGFNSNDGSAPVA